MGLTHLETTNLISGIHVATLLVMIILTNKEINVTLVALMDAYKYYVSMAKNKRSNTKEAAIWQDKAMAVESLALTMQSKPALLKG